MLEYLLDKSRALFRHPLAVIITCLAITVICALSIPYIQIDNDITHMLPLKDKVKVTFDKYEKIFGSSTLIFIGVEGKNIYARDFLVYLDYLVSELEKLNGLIPAENVAKYLGLTKEEAGQVIGVMSEQGLAGEAEMKALLTDGKRLEEEYFFSPGLAAKIAQQVNKADIKKLMIYYQVPVKDINSIIASDFIAGTKDGLSVQKLINREDINDTSIALLKHRVDSWPVFQGGLVSYDNTLTTVLLQLNSLDINIKTAVYRHIKRITDKTRPAGVNIYIAGEPFINNAIADYMIKDVKLLLPLVIIAVVGALYFSFRNIQGVLLPLIAVTLSVVWSVGLMVYSGIPLNIITTLLPVLLMAVGSAYGIHFMNTYFMSRDSDKFKIINENMSGVGLAIAMAGLTTVAGFGSLVTSNFVPIKHFAIFTALGVMFALLIALYLLPALLLAARGPKKIFSHHEGKTDLLVRLLKKIVTLIQKHYKLINVTAALFAVICAVGVFRIKAEMDTVSFFKKSSPIRRADDMLNKKLSGTQVLNIILESKDGGQIMTLPVLKKIDEFELAVKNRLPIVKKVVSINDYIRKMNQEMNGGDPAFYSLPDSDMKVNDYLIMYSGKLDMVATDAKDKLKITLSVNKASTRDIEKVKKFCLGYFAGDFLDANRLNILTSGVLELTSAVNRSITWGQITSLISSLILVFLINILVFRKLGLAVISVVPIIFTLIVTFGLMGYLGIPLNAGTAMVASVAIGIGVDYAIHFIVKYLREMKISNNIDVAVHNTVMETGRGILYNVFSVMAGFLVLVFSEFSPLVAFGALVSLNMLTTGLGAMILIPSIFKGLEGMKKGRG